MNNRYAKGILENLDPMAVKLAGDSLPYTKLAAAYLEALLTGNRLAAVELIESEVSGGMPIQDVYLYIFQRTQQEVGRLWQINQITVAQEHYCSAATQLVMSLLYPRIFTGERNGLRAVATSVGGELHEIGIRMVADFLEMEGWDTYYLGANAPVDTVLEALLERQADLLAVSATMTFHLPQVENLIDQLRQDEYGGRIPILVGGRPFTIAPDVWQQVGADGTAADAREAVQAAAKLVERNKNYE